MGRPLSRPPPKGRSNGFDGFNGANGANGQDGLFLYRALLTPL